MKKALGKGLSALIPDSYSNEEAASEKEAVQIEKKEGIEKTISNIEAKPEKGFLLIDLEKIKPNPEQPRQTFSEESIEELASSIKEKGILQPVIVSKKDDGYILICGERRFRASKLCGLKQIPAIVKDLASDAFLEWGLIENIQREDLNPLEEALAYGKLVDENNLSQEEVARRVGKNRTTITNTLRLLRLPESVRNYIVSGQLSAGHARALLGLLTPEHQRQMAKRIVEENLSVRQVEAIVGRSAAHKKGAKKARSLSPELADLETKLSHHFGTQVKVFPRKNQKEGRIEIQFYSLDELDRILDQTGLSRD